MEKQGIINTHPALKKYGLDWDQIQVQEQKWVCLLPPKPGIWCLRCWVGNMGVQKLKGKVRDLFYWPGVVCGREEVVGGCGMFVKEDRGLYFPIRRQEQ